MSKRDSIAVVGAGGYMGRFYVKALVELGLDPAKIIGIEPDDLRRGTLLKVSDIRVAASISEVANSIKAAIIVVPGPLHREVINSCISYGIRNLFVEKPLVSNVRELEGLSKRGVKIYTGYLINFSGVIPMLQEFIHRHKLVCVSVAGLWGKNWASIDRPIGADSVEELPHPLAVALSILRRQGMFLKIERKGILKTYIQYVRPELDGRARASGFEADTDDSCMGLFEVQIGTRIVPIRITSSFNMVKQTRQIELILAPRNGGFQTHKVMLEFDLSDQGVIFDQIMIYESRSSALIHSNRSSNDKLRAQLKAVLEAFETGKADARLVDFALASEIVRLLDER